MRAYVYFIHFVIGEFLSDMNRPWSSAHDKEHVNVNPLASETFEYDWK